MLRSPDDPKFRLSSRVPAETHRRQPEVAMKDAFTIGIEEEYFLVDAATKQVTRDMPKTFLDIAKKATNGQAMGEFLQSQCEVATLAAPRHPHRPRRASASAPDGGEDRGRSRPRHPGRRHPPDRRLGPLAAIRGRALRRGDGRSADDRPAQHAVRATRTCRTAGPRRPGRRDDADAALSAAVHRARHVVAVLALAADRAQGLSARRLRRAAAHRRARAVAQQRGIRRLCGCAGDRPA